jgi:hypothetical protein
VWIHSTIHGDIRTEGSIVIPKVNLDNKQILFGIPMPTSDGNFIASRYITVKFSNNQIVFGDGMLGTSVLNVRGVPLYVYGVK